MVRWSYNDNDPEVTVFQFFTDFADQAIDPDEASEWAEDFDLECVIDRPSDGVFPALYRLTGTQADIYALIDDFDLNVMDRNSMRLQVRPVDSLALGVEGASVDQME